PSQQHHARLAGQLETGFDGADLPARGARAPALRHTSAAQTRRRREAPALCHYMNEAFTLTLGLLAAGYACARLHVFPEQAAETLHRFVIYVCLPALVLSLVPKLRWERELWLVVFMPWLMAAVGALLVLC